MTAKLSVYLGFAAEVGELFQKGVEAGLSHEQLVKVAKGQLDLEERQKKSHEANQRSYG